MKSRDDVVTALLLDLNVMGLGEAAPAEEQSYVDARLDGMLDDLVARRKLFITDSTQIPDPCFEPLLACLVLRFGPKFGRAEPALTEVIAAEDRLKAASAPVAPRPTLELDPALRGTTVPFAGIRY
jgi:hypothetical protein